MPTKGCSRDAVSCTLRVINPICLKSRRYASFRIGYTAGITDCRRSFKKWRKPMAAKTPNAVALDLLREETRVAGLTPVWLDTVGSLALARNLWGRPPGLRGSSRTALCLSPSYRLNGSSLIRSEEHTSELQSPCNLVCRL